MLNKTISNFLSKEYKDFAMYVIECRAIPSVIDGFKHSQRKIIHVSNNIWKSGSEKSLKIFQLGGKVASDTFYHHGNISLENSIVLMAQKFKNNAPLLEDLGQFGSLRSPQAGATRYIETKLSPNFRLIYKDFELLECKEEEGNIIEPKFFLPIVPMVLVNGSSGIAVGFSSNILNRNIFDVIEACVSVINKKKINKIFPCVKEFSGKFIQDIENPKKWYIRGIFKVVNTSTVRVTDLPPSMTYEKYEEHLDKLIENKVITSYDDNCKNNIDYTIKFNRSTLKSLSEQDLIKLLKLEETSTEIFSVLDEFGKLKIFDSDYDIVNYFVEFRLKYYEKRKQFLIKKLKENILMLSNKAKFIKYIIENKIKINNVPKSDVIINIEKFKLDKIDSSYDYLLKMPIYSLTKELYEKLIEDISIKNKELLELKSTKPVDMYLDDLNELKSKIK